MRAFVRARGGKDWGDAGFTLIEVMIAAIILAVGLLAIANMLDIALSRNVDAKRMTTGTNMAIEMLERIRFNAPANATNIIGVGYPYHNIAICNAACTAAQIQAVCSTCSGVVGQGNATSANNKTANGEYN